jgi:hypothetical protein
MGLEHLIDGISQLAPTPILKPMDATAIGFDHAAVALDHGGHLFALIGVH